MERIEIMKQNKTYPWYFSLGALLLFTVLVFLPSMIGIFYSFTDWNSFSDKINFVGLQNFKTILFNSNHMYVSFISNTLKFTVYTTIFKMTISFILALLFTRGIKFANFHRMVAFSPQVLSFLVIGIVFKGILHPSQGFLNIFLKNIGLGFLAQDWLGTLKYAFPTIVSVDTWRGVGYGMVIFIAGIKSIPESFYEAADIDGANFIQKTLRITIPLLTPTLIVNVILNITYGLRIFDMVYVLTNGGPGYATDVINTAVFKEFSRGNYAVGTTLSTLLTLFTILISYFILKGLNRKVEY